MALFPTTWQLLLPNWNIFTLIGVALIILGVLVLYLSAIASAFLEILPFSPLKLGWFLVLSGIFSIWGISIFEDFIVSMGGKVILGGIITVILVALLLFYHPQEKQGRFY